jgi:CRISPR system Cascade subunit CasE
MKLSRLILNPLNREVARAVSDVHRLHQLVMMGFDGDAAPAARAQHCVLHRLEIDPRSGALVLYVQSASEPDWTRLPVGMLAALEDRRNPDARDLTELDLVAPGKLARFRLRANPTRKIETKSIDGQRRHGHRVPHRNDERCIEWLVRKGNDHGFEIVRDGHGQPNVMLIREPARRGRRGNAAITFEGVRFDGLLRILDAEAFRSAVVNGVGSAKAYGFGLLSFAPVGG